MPARRGSLRFRKCVRGANRYLHGDSRLTYACYRGADCRRIESAAWAHVAVPGLTMHSTGSAPISALLTGAAGETNVRGGVNIFDARSGELHMRILLPQQLMTGVDALHGDFLTIDENGHRLFAITSLDGSPQNTALTVAQLASVPLAIGSVSSPTVCCGRHVVDDSRKRVSIGNKACNRRQAGNGNLGGYEYAEPGFTCSSGRFPTANAHDREWRDCFIGRCGDRQLDSNFSR